MGASQARRKLIIAAEDFGIGRATSAGIVALARRGLVTGAALLVTSPHAAAAVSAWRGLHHQLELGWQLNLTLDGPAAPPSRVPTLLDGSSFTSTRTLWARWLCGRLSRAELEVELHAQLDRFGHLAGRTPAFVTARDHVGLLPPVAASLAKVLQSRGLRPYVRRELEPWKDIAQKLSATRACRYGLAQWQARRYAGLFPGNDAVARLQDFADAGSAAPLVESLRARPGQVLELACQPGYLDPSRLGRGRRMSDGRLQAAVEQQRLLELPGLRAALHDAFDLVRPSSLLLARKPHERAA